MKNLFVLLVLGMISANAQAAILGAPFLPEIDKRFDNIENSPFSLPQAGNSGLMVSHYAKAIFNISAMGTYTPTNTVVIPANAIIKQAYWYSSATGSPSAGTTLAFQCDTANDIYSATDISAIAVNTITAGIQTGTAANMKLVTTSGGCIPKAVLAVHPVTAGVVNLFLDYVIAK